MKKTVILCAMLSLLILAAGCRKKQTDRFSLAPAKPVPGGRITVVFAPAGTPLAEASAVELIAYFCGKGLPDAHAFPMELKDRVWTASFATETETRCIILKFQADEAVDNNGKKGYAIPLFEEKGLELPGALAGLADAQVAWGRSVAGLEPDIGLALSLYEKDFEVHPEIKREHLSNYLSVVSRLKKEDRNEIIAAELDELAALPDLTVQDLTNLNYWHGRLQNFDLAHVYGRLLKERDPSGEFVQAERAQEIVQELDIVKKTRLYEIFRGDFPASKLTPNLLVHITTAFGAKGDYAGAASFLDKNQEIAAWNAYSQLAIQIASKGGDFPRAGSLALKAAEFGRMEYERPAEAKPAYLTESEWKSQRGNSLGQVLGLYGQILVGLNRSQEAAPILEEAVGLTKGKISAINEFYVEALAKAGRGERALAEIQIFLQTGNGTSRMKELFKSAYALKYGGETGYAELLANLESLAREKSTARLKAEMIDLPAPDFSLEDLEGNRVSLSDLKDKVAVLDFWAVRSGRASFPAMKSAVEKFKDSPDVEFLFINSWEIAADIKKDVLDFITVNGFPFHVLLDTDNAVIDAYRVEGIPGRVVLDKKGRIRFKTTGAPDNAEKFLEEISLMVEILR